MILYRVALLMALPVLAAVAARRGGLAERLALQGGDKGVVWLHGASNGEIASARSVIASLSARGDKVLITCNNPTAKRMVTDWALPGVSARLAPFDALPIVRRFLHLHTPRALIVIENELWPERILSTASRGIPVMAIGARMSERSAKRWQRIPLMRRMLGAMSWVSAQDGASEGRLLSLGLPPDRLGPRMMLKSAIDGVPIGDHPNRTTTLLAASTHEGEDEAILDAFTRQTRFDRLIIAPRHPRRGPQVAELARARGLDTGLRSSGAEPDHAVYVADTLGEMPHWYAMAGATFIGGTFAPKGGHTPFEPAAFRSAILHGPSVHNFAEVFATLTDAAIAVTPDTLAGALDALTPARQTTLASAALDALPPPADAGTVIAALDALAPRQNV